MEPSFRPGHGDTFRHVPSELVNHIASDPVASGSSGTDRAAAPRRARPAETALPGRPGAGPGEPHRRAHRLQRRVRPAGRDRPRHRDRLRPDGRPAGRADPRRDRRARRRSTSTRSANGPATGSTTWPGRPGRSQEAGVAAHRVPSALLASDLPTGRGPLLVRRARARLAWALAGDGPPPLEPLALARIAQRGRERLRRRPVGAHGPVRLGVRRGRLGALPGLPHARPSDRSRSRPACASSSATPASTHQPRWRRVQHPASRSATGPSPPSSAAGGSGARRRCATSTPRCSAGTGHRLDPVDRRRAEHIVGRERPGPRDRAAPCAQATARRSAGSSPRATPRCATCSRSRRRRWTRSSRSRPRRPVSSAARMTGGGFGGCTVNLVRPRGGRRRSGRPSNATTPAGPGRRRASGWSRRPTGAGASTTAARAGDGRSSDDRRPRSASAASSARPTADLGRRSSTSSGWPRTSASTTPGSSTTSSTPTARRTCPCLEAWTLLAALAAKTSRIRLGRPRLEQHVPPPGPARQGGGDRRPRERRTAHPRPRHGLARGRAPPLRHRPAAASASGWTGSRRPIVMIRGAHQPGSARRSTGRYYRLDDAPFSAAPGPGRTSRSSSPPTGRGCSGWPPATPTSGTRSRRSRGAPPTGVETPVAERIAALDAACARDRPRPGGDPPLDLGRAGGLRDEDDVRGLRAHATGRSASPTSRSSVPPEGRRDLLERIARETIPALRAEFARVRPRRPGAALRPASALRRAERQAADELLLQGDVHDDRRDARP